jgi:GMP synthase-like glutamine amidotransferase
MDWLMKILVFQHVASEHPGSFRDVMKAHGHSMHAVELDEGETIPNLDDYDILLVMGGPMDVWETEQHPWLLDEMEAIKNWVGSGRPYLGMCLGHQLLAQACGGQVRLMDGKPEVGISQVALTPDPLFTDVPPLCTCFQWHGAEVSVLPPGASVLASSPGCGIQAIRLGDCAYGLQFHMELTQTTAAEWGMLPEYAAALERVKGPGAMPMLQAEVDAAFIPLQDAATRIFSNFLAIAERALVQA